MEDDKNGFAEIHSSPPQKITCNFGVTEIRGPYYIYTYSAYGQRHLLDVLDGLKFAEGREFCINARKECHGGAG